MIGGDAFYETYNLHSERKPMTDTEKTNLKNSIIAEIQKDAEVAKEKSFFVHGHIAWIAVALFAVTTVCNIIDVVAPKSVAAKDALKVEHVITAHPALEKLIVNELERLIEKAEK